MPGSGRSRRTRIRRHGHRPAALAPEVKNPMPDPDIHDGGCSCGAVRYCTLGQPANTAVCHCSYCPTRTGSAFGVSVYFLGANLEQLSGELKDYTFETESGRGFTTRFCTTCGTTVFWSLAMTPDLTGSPAAPSIRPRSGIRFRAKSSPSRRRHSRTRTCPKSTRPPPAMSRSTTTTRA